MHGTGAYLTGYLAQPGRLGYPHIYIKTEAIAGTALGRHLTDYSTLSPALRDLGYIYSSPAQQKENKCGALKWVRFKWRFKWILGT